MVKYQGKVIKKLFGESTKSEHDAVMLVTPQGEYRLRREGGNPFFDEELEKLVGKAIRCQGFVHGHTLIMSHWDELADDQKENSG
jgi:hypothetical protein